jgi:molybdopterin-guanine dinucleotide biosynthesis protein A
MSSFLKNCTGIILAGGENRRMPFPKAFIRVNGIRIIEKNLTILKSLFSETFIVTNEPELYAYLDTGLLGDIYAVKGPMTGILTSLVNSSNRWSFITACDMPFINAVLIRYIFSQRNGYDAVAPRLYQQTEPLFALYSKHLIPSMEKALVSGKTGLQDFLRGNNVKYIQRRDIQKIDPGERSLINLNTPGDVTYYLEQGGNRKHPGTLQADTLH